MGMGGVYREIKAPERIVNTEKFDEAWYPGEALGTLVLMEQGGKTTHPHAPVRHALILGLLGLVAVRLRCSAENAKPAVVPHSSFTPVEGACTPSGWRGVGLYG